MADRGMGRGLAAILQVSGQHGERPELRDIPVDLISAGSHQPRRRFDEDALDALAGSIAEQGVLQPVLVRPLDGGRYELVAGERRWRAAQRAQLEVIPAIIQQRDDAASLEAAIVENMAREDLNPVEEARAVAALTEELGLTREEAGKRVGRGRVAISNLLRLLDLPKSAQALLEDGTLTEGHGRALLLATDHGTRKQLARDAAAGGWSVRVLEDRARAANAAADDHRDPAHSRSKRAAHPDQEAACGQIAETIAGMLARETKVAPKGTSYRVQFVVEDLDDAVDLVNKLRPVRVG